jgi:hypothetical protein
MSQPQFDSTGFDRQTYAPFVLQNALETKWKDVRLSFDNWDWLEETYGTDTIDDYYLNGYGIERLVMAGRLSAGLPPEPDTIHYNSEGDTCYIHFTDLAEAVRTAELAAEMLQERERLVAMIALARENGFEEG